MTKPFMGVSASGCHITCLYGKVESCNKQIGSKQLPGVEEVFGYMQGGTNTFMPDTKDMQLPGKIGLQSIAGIMEHLPALTALGSSTVNSTEDFGIKDSGLQFMLIGDIKIELVD